MTNRPTPAMRPVRLSGQRTARQHAGQSGVGLIEVLVAVLVLSIAFLGIAALQAMSLSTNNSAMARSMATVASYSILDAMRADIGGARNGDYNTTTPIAANACPAPGSTLASVQISQWCSVGLGNRSFGATARTTGAIACTAAGTASADCTITITFDDSRTGAGSSSAQQVATRAML